MTSRSRHIGSVHLADAVYLQEKGVLCLYFVTDDNGEMVIAYVRSRDPQALLSGFFAAKDSITAYDFNGYLVPAKDN